MTATVSVDGGNGNGDGDNVTKDFLIKCIKKNDLYIDTFLQHIKSNNNKNSDKYKDGYWVDPDDFVKLTSMIQKAKRLVVDLCMSAPDCIHDSVYRCCLNTLSKEEGYLRKNTRKLIRKH